MKGADKTLNIDPMRSRLSIPVDRIFWLLLLVFVVNNWLLLAFLGQGPSLAAIAVVCAGVGLLYLSGRNVFSRSEKNVVSLKTLAVCFCVALVLLIIGGEGRLLYSNADWQVRDAVLYDMAKTAWPFSYIVREQEAVLRAPLGMYLLPALLSKGIMGSADLLLLLSNSFILTLLLAGASALFQTSQHRFIAVLVFLVFSGLDSVGTFDSVRQGRNPSLDHLELWADHLQYSSNLTLLYWVPQHAFAGWACALAIVLYLKRQISLGLVTATIPLVALWSPLAIMGAAPFVGWIGLKALLKREVRLNDFLVGSLSLIVALPALAYLASGSATLHKGVRMPDSVVMFLILEIGVWFAMLGILRGTARLGYDMLALTFILLCLFPFLQLGTGIDFQMRASITPLAILCCLIALSLGPNANKLSPMSFALTVMLFTLASVTGLKETLRSFTYLPSPAPLCTLPQVWTKQSGRIAEIETYLTPRNTLPQWLTTATGVTKIEALEKAECWSRSWFTRRNSVKSKE